MKKRAFISVNFAVLLFGLAGLFAKWIRLPALTITFGRVLFSSLALGLFMLFRKQSFRISNRKDLLLLAGAGVILAIHWWSFLAAIQLSTVAIGTITFSAFPLFVTFLEPLVFRQKLKPRNVILAVVILIGVFITIPEFSFENKTFTGILVGLVSALTYAVLTLLNKIFAGKYSSTLTAFYEQVTAAIVLFPLVMRAGGFHPAGTDLALLLFLGIVTTALAHTLFISGLKELPAQLAGICSSMETVYGILFALLFLGEVPSLREVIGAVIIIGAVIAAQLGQEREG
ncbi:MAG: DMT family transporter [Flexilinea sp.]|nr:DMT family transporter [Flexilinea sp.]